MRQLREQRDADGHPMRWTEIGDRLGISRDAARRAYARAVGVEAARAPLDPTHPQLLRLERDNALLADTVRELKRKVRATHREAALFDALAETIKEHAAPFPVAPAPAFDSRKVGLQRTPVDAVLLLSDEHADQVIDPAVVWGLEDYDFNIFRCRLQRLADVITEYVTIHLPAHQFERLWIFKLGDTVNGDIHDAGPRNHFANTVKAALAVGDAEAQFVQQLLPHFPGGVHVVGVSGNHPRRTRMKDYDGPHDNYDYLAGVQLATRLGAEIAAGRVTVTLPESFSAYVEVRGRLWALNHGDDVLGYSGIPWVGFDKRNNRVQSILATADEHADYFAYGHYHTAAEFASAGGRSFHSGAWTYVDPFALEKLALGGHEPVQTLYVMDDKHGIILPVPIYTRDRSRESAFRAGRYEPLIGRGLAVDAVNPQGRATPGVNIIREGKAA